MNSPLTVYIDFKSPYAYLAIEPTRRMARELGISINWLPFVLDIPSYLGSAKLDKSGAVAKASRSEQQWSGVKYAYYDCRRYANLCGKTIRGTVKIWDTNLAAIGMLWAKQQGDEILQRYIDGVYVPFWKRELDVEELAVIETVLIDAGAVVQGFKAFAEGEGAQSNQRLQHDSFEQGVFGVPTYALGDELYFGREHLPRIRWQLAGEQGPAPDIGCDILSDDVVEKTTVRTLEVGISLEEPESYLAIPSIISMADEVGIDVSWHALAPKIHSSTGDDSDQSRGARHRRLRRANRQHDRHRYMTKALAGAAIESAIRSTLDQHQISLQQSEAAAAWSGAGYVTSPVFKLGEETFVGRQHIPLIRARLK